MGSVKILYRGGSAETEEKKSRFICTVAPVHTPGEAAGFIADIRKKYWNATHNCPVYVIGSSPPLERCSDDGEPQGTAGRPMLDVIRGAGIHDLCAVVTRYFGGTLLGTGGLVRAYSKAVQEGLKNCVVLDRIDGVKLTVTTDYTGLGRIQYICAQQNVKISDSRYADHAQMDLLVPVENTEKIRAALVEGTNGDVRFEEPQPVRYALLDGEPVYFD